MPTKGIPELGMAEDEYQDRIRRVQDALSEAAIQITDEAGPSVNVSRKHLMRRIIDTGWDALFRVVQDEREIAVIRERQRRAALYRQSRNGTSL